MLSAHEIFEAYFDWLEDTESPVIYHRWALIGAISTLIGRQLSILPGSPLHAYPNQYLVLVGPAAARKNTALKIPKQLLKAADFNCFASDRTSKAKFIEDMSLGFSFEHETDELLEFNASFVGADETPAYIHAPELQDFFAQGDMDFISFLTNLWDMPDKYNYRTRNGKSIKISNPCINLIGGATPTTLGDIFPSKIAGQGFLSRGLLIYAGGQRKQIAFPSPPDDAVFQEFVEIFKLIKHNAIGEATISSGAKKLLEDIYKGWKPIPDIRMESYTGRRYTSLLKNCMIIAAMRLENKVEINEDDVIYANSMLTFAEGFMPSCLGNMGSSPTLILQNHILNTLNKNPIQGMPVPEIYKEVSAYFTSLQECARILQDMARLETIVISDGKIFPTPRGPKEGIHCDFNLLREAKHYYAELETGSEPETEDSGREIEELLKFSESSESTETL